MRVFRGMVFAFFCAIAANTRTEIQQGASHQSASSLAHGNMGERGTDIRAVQINPNAANKMSCEFLIGGCIAQTGIGASRAYCRTHRGFGDCVGKQA